jgi:dTDP-4-amino-4,6-dideoxygalactose transaminase
MNIPMINLTRQYLALKAEIDRAVREVLTSGVYINGSKVDEFENNICRLLNVKHAIGVASGTDALLLALHALNIGYGDQVAVPGFTFYATAEVVSRLGAAPVFIDVEPDTFTIDVNCLQEALRKNRSIKAVIPVHLFGLPCDLEALMLLAEKYGLLVIEDACQAINAEMNYKGEKVKTGVIGQAGCFSFFPTKNLGAYGDGGMVVTNDDDLANTIHLLRSHGSNRKYFHSMVGYNSRLDALQAAVLNVKLAYIDEWSKKRRKVACLYNAGFKASHIEQLICPLVKDGHVFNQYVLRVKERDGLAEYLKQRGISTAVYYPLPLHLQECYQGLGYKEGDLPVCEELSRTVLALPINPELSNEEVMYIVRAIKEFTCQES